MNHQLWIPLTCVASEPYFQFDLFRLAPLLRISVTRKLDRLLRQLSVRLGTVLALPTIPTSSSKDQGRAKGRGERPSTKNEYFAFGFFCARSEKFDWTDFPFAKN